MERDGVYAVILVTVLGAFFRIFRLDSNTLWLDEALSYSFASSQSAWEILIVLPQIDPHPPLYYLILHYWIKLAGVSEFALRFPSAVFGAAAVPVLYVLTIKLYDHRVALLSSSVLAIAPFQIIYSQEARMYSLFVLLTITSMYFLVSWLTSSSNWSAIGYGITTVLLGYTHVYALFIIAAQNLYAVRWYGPMLEKSMPSFRRWIGIQSGIGVMLLPWVGMLVGRALLSRSNATSWLTPPGIGQIIATPVVWVTGAGVHLALILLVPLTSAAILIYVIAAVYSEQPRYVPTMGIDLSKSIDFDRLRRLREGELVLFWVSVPVISGILLSYLVEPIYAIRYTIAAAIAFYVLVAKGIDLIQPRRIRYILAALLLVGLLAPLPGYYTERETEAWNDVTAHIEANADADDLVIVSDDYMQVPFDYYWNGSNITVRTVSDTERNHDALWDRAYARISVSRVQSIVDDYDDVWLVLSHTSATHDERILSAIGTPKELVNRTSYPGIDVYNFRSDRAESSEESDSGRREIFR